MFEDGKDGDGGSKLSGAEIMETQKESSLVLLRSPRHPGTPHPRHLW